MKRYLVFYGWLRYPKGGAKDYVMDFSVKKDAHNYAQTVANQHRNNWSQVWDTKSNIVEEYYYTLEDDD